MIQNYPTNGHQAGTFFQPALICFLLTFISGTMYTVGCICKSRPSSWGFPEDPRQENESLWPDMSMVQDESESTQTQEFTKTEADIQGGPLGTTNNCHRNQPINISTGSEPKSSCQMAPRKLLCRWVGSEEASPSLAVYQHQLSFLRSTNQQHQERTYTWKLGLLALVATSETTHHGEPWVFHSG